MGIEQGSFYCPECQRLVAATRTTPNHALHLLITLFLCGAWLPIWMLAAFTRGHWSCNYCGYRPRSVVLSFVAGLAFALIAGGVLIFLVMQLRN